MSSNAVASVAGRLIKSPPYLERWPPCRLQAVIRRPYHGAPPHHPCDAALTSFTSRASSLAAADAFRCAVQGSGGTGQARVRRCAAACGAVPASEDIRLRVASSMLENPSLVLIRAVTARPPPSAAEASVAPRDDATLFDGSPPTLSSRGSSARGAHAPLHRAARPSGPPPSARLPSQRR